MGNLVAIVGRPNVGKSTLFNRLTRTRQAIVNEEAGTTRDRQYGKSEWLGREFSVVDTGGWVVNSDDIFEEEIRKQVMLAVDEADAILFVVDVVNGLTDLDAEVADILRRTRKPVMLVANKTDNFNQQYQAAEFYALGLGDPYCISAISGSGTGELLDALVATFRKEAEELVDDDIPRIAVVGRPNAGKSSLINAFIGEDRHIVTEIRATPSIRATTSSASTSTWSTRPASARRTRSARTWSTTPSSAPYGPSRAPTSASSCWTPRAASRART